MLMMLLSSSTPADTAGPQLRSMLSNLHNQSVYFIGSPSNSSGLPITLVSGCFCMTWRSELDSQGLSLLGEALRSSLVAEVARSTAGQLLPSVPLASTWSLWFHCWHTVLPALLNSCIHRGCPQLIRALTAD